MEYRIDELPGVRSANTHIVSRGRDVDVAIDLDTSPSVNIPVLTDQIVNLAHEIVEKQLGVKIHGKVNIRVRHEPYPRGTMPTTVPLGEEPIVPPGRVQAPAPALSTPAPAASIRSEPRAMPSPPPAEKPLPTAPEVSGIEEEFGEEEEEEGKESPSGW
ncbi:MAG: hypothetical protein H5T69_13545 [Chloroflexi bacterium]|nr:hypothetical protein [Chloroflexota bacterium]